MNLFGNALKYTTKGFIEVKLASEPLDGETHSVHLTVIDSGKGISSEYLRTKLYTPFAQENSLAPGTGLGLSIVNTIVNMLQGEIKIDSKVGLGTVAHVTIPMQKASSAGDASESASGSDTSREHASNDIFDIIQQAAKGKTCSMRGFNTKDSQDYMFRDTADNRLLLLRKYFVDWFGFSVASSPSTDGEIVVVDENNVADLTTAGLDAPGKENGPILLIVCKSAARSVRTSEYQNAGGIVEVISEPIGPYKLAKALQICFQRYNAIRGGSSTSGGPPKTPLRQSNGSGFNDVLDGFGGLTIKDSLANSTQVAGNKPPNPPDNSANGNPDLSNTSESLDTTQMNGFKVPSRRASQVAETSQNLTQPPQILLVDDNLINLKLLETFMKKRKYQSVKSAMNGHEAVEAFKEAKRFDVIFMVCLTLSVLKGFL